MQIETADVSLIGHREENQDRVAVAAGEHAVLLAVIDGMQMDCEMVIVAPDLATLDSYSTGLPRLWAVFRSVPSATRPRPPIVLLIRSAARCNSPTSCATCRKTRNGAASIYHGSGWMKRTCRTIPLPP